MSGAPKHDPGGKVRIQLPDGILGEALISACERYRPSMSRDWTKPGQVPKSILWIGMNPSTANAFVSDPTCNRELIFSRDWGYSRYLKGNMLDWRATNPKDLPPPELARSENNIPEILRMAEASEAVVMAYGKLHLRYQPFVEETISALQQIGTPLLCLGLNKDGSAKHPLYLRKDTQLKPFRP
jgi:hypothetical protein